MMVELLAILGAASAPIAPLPPGPRPEPRPEPRSAHWVAGGQSQPASSEPGPSGSSQSGSGPGNPSPKVEVWRELVQLELFGEVLAQAGAVREPGGALAKSPEALSLLARAAFETRGPGAALNLLAEREALASTPPVRLERARILIELDELDRALGELGSDEAAATDFAQLPERWLHLGRIHARRGELAAARGPLERFVGLAPRHPETPSALYVLAQEAVRRGDGDAARAHSARGRQLGEWLAYLRVRRLQVRESPNEPLPLLGLALVWMGANELEPAAEVLDRLLARFPDHASGWFHRGEVRRLSGDLDGARADYDRALELDPNERLARFNRAVIARMRGQFEAATADFTHLADGPGADDPRLLSAHLELARLLLAAGEAEAAATRYADYRSRGGQEPLTR